MNPFKQIVDLLEMLKQQWETSIGSGIYLSRMLERELRLLEGIEIPPRLLEPVQDFIRSAKKVVVALAAFGNGAVPRFKKLYNSVYEESKESLIGQARTLMTAWT